MTPFTRADMKVVIPVFLARPFLSR